DHCRHAAPRGWAGRSHQRPAPPCCGGAIAGRLSHQSKGKRKAAPQLGCGPRELQDGFRPALLHSPRSSLLGAVLELLIAQLSLLLPNIRSDAAAPFHVSCEIELPLWPREPALALLVLLLLLQGHFRIPLTISLSRCLRTEPQRGKQQGA